MDSPPTFRYPGRDGDGTCVIREIGLSFDKCTGPSLKNKVLVLLHDTSVYCRVT